jgi:DNA-binding CsgD family transcriptional regulator
VVLLGSGGRPAELDLLTEAEEAVALLAVEGLTNAEIASRRGRSNKTVANQLASIYRKLGVKSREQLVRLLSDISAV